MNTAFLCEVKTKNLFLLFPMLCMLTLTACPPDGGFDEGECRKACDGAPGAPDDHYGCQSTCTQRAKESKDDPTD